MKFPTWKLSKTHTNFCRNFVRMFVSFYLLKMKEQKWSAFCLKNVFLFWYIIHRTWTQFYVSLNFKMHKDVPYSFFHSLSHLFFIDSSLCVKTTVRTGTVYIRVCTIVHVYMHLMRLQCNECMHLPVRSTGLMRLHLTYPDPSCQYWCIEMMN